MSKLVMFIKHCMNMNHNDEELFQFSLVSKDIVLWLILLHLSLANALKTVLFQII